MRATFRNTLMRVICQIEKRFDKDPIQADFYEGHLRHPLMKITFRNALIMAAFRNTLKRVTFMNFYQGAYKKC